MADKKKGGGLLSKIVFIIFGSFAAAAVGGIILSFVLSENGGFDSGKFSTFFPIILGLCLIAALLYFMNTKESKVEMKGKDDLENQRWMRYDEMGKKFKNFDWRELGNVQNLDAWPIDVRYKNGKMKIHFAPKGYHLLAVGATGSGKTVTLVEPTIQILSELGGKPSMFITDTKGELFNHHSKKLKESGYNVVQLNLAEPYNSVQWNPMESVYDNYQESMRLEEKILVHTNDDVNKYNLLKVGEISNDKWYEFLGKAFGSMEVVLNEVEVERVKLVDECYADLHDIATALCPIENKRDPGWEQGARDYIYACMIAMLEDSGDPRLGMIKERFNFYNLYRIVMNKENDMEYAARYFQGRSPHSKTKGLIGPIVDSKAKQTRDSYMSTLANKLSMFADNGVCLLTSKNNIKFMEFDETPTAFFILIPDEIKTRYTLASVCIGQAYKEFVRKARRNQYAKGGAASDEDAKLKRPLYYIMDEFANLPPVPDMEKMITISRGRRIYFMLIIQSYSQLANTYGKENHDTIRANCNGQIYVGTGDQETREQFSKMLGNYQVKVDSKGSQKGGDGKPSESTNTSFQSRPLIYPSDLSTGMKYGRLLEYFYPEYPIDAWIDSYYTAQNIYKLGKMERPYVPGQRLNEDFVFYDIKERNKKVLGIE